MGYIPLASENGRVLMEQKDIEDALNEIIETQERHEQT